MSTIFDNLKGNIDLSIFGKSNADPKTPLRRHYLSLVGLLEYVDILNGDLTGRNLPDGITEETVKGMIIHCIGDLDTVKAMRAGDGPEPEQYVDLGLPSGTLWATENIKDVNGNELYFAWGETKGYTKSEITGGVRSFSLQSYKYNENPSTLDAEHDAATVNWGSDCKMPTQDHFKELFENTTRVYKDGKLIFKSKINGNSIEFKALGYAQENEVLDEGNFGHYWTSSLGESNNANSLYFSSAIQIVDGDSRIYGRLIRPIKPKPEQPEQHDYVDLGLPSGTLWATENIKDANGKELYFAWGETQGYAAEQVGTAKIFDWSDYKFGEKSELTKYNETDKKTKLESGDDAATDNWGKDWKMPTKEQFEELISNTDYEWTEIDGVQGAKFTSKVEGYTDRFLFFPAVGSAEGGKVSKVGDDGFYWSVSLGGKDVDDAWDFCFDDGGCRMSYDGRCYGNSVRPVRLQNQ